MASIRMYGVVLWSSEQEGRAVIWCEDHGKLAFYASASESGAVADMHGGVSLDAGDLIEFDVEDRENQRRAHNPRLLVPDHAPCIAMDLRQEAVPPQGASEDAAVYRSDASQQGAPDTYANAEHATVVPFRRRVDYTARARAVG